MLCWVSGLEVGGGGAVHTVAVDKDLIDSWNRPAKRKVDLDCTDWPVHLAVRGRGATICCTSLEGGRSEQQNLFDISH